MVDTDKEEVVEEISEETEGEDEERVSGDNEACEEVFEADFSLKDEALLASLEKCTLSQIHSLSPESLAKLIGTMERILKEEINRKPSDESDKFYYKKMFLIKCLGDAIREIKDAPRTKALGMCEKIFERLPPGNLPFCANVGKKIALALKSSIVCAAKQGANL